MSPEFDHHREVDGWLAEGLFLLRLARRGLDPRDFDVIWYFNPLLTSTGGNASYTVGSRLHRIELSAPLWERGTLQERRQIVMHELCHVVDYVLHERSSGHGKPWKDLMRDLRLDPRRCHHICTLGSKALA